MIEFPETAAREWEVAAAAVEAEHALRRRIIHDTDVEREQAKLRVRHDAALAFQQELDADATPVLEMLTLADYRSNPSSAPVDLIDGVVKKDGMCLVIGPSGSGKSTLALQMIHSFETGTEWIGQTTKPLTGSYGVLSYDMDASMALDWITGFPGVDASKISVVNAYKRGNPLGVKEMRAQIAAAWRTMGVEVIILDSFSASFFGHDQNDAASVMAHYRDMKLFALTECEAKALIVIAHSTASSPDKARGSTVHHDVADSIVSVEGTGADPRKVRMVKYRAARGQKEMSPVILGAPDSVTHLVSVNPQAMTMEGLHLPPSLAAEAFTDVPDNYEEPDTSVGEEEDEEL